MPPAPLTADGPAVFVSVGENAVVGEGVSYVHMRNLKLVGPAPFDPAESDNEVSNTKRVLGPQLHARGTGVVFRNATGVTLSGCEVAMHGTAGLVIDGRNNGERNPLANDVSRCVFTPAALCCQPCATARSTASAAAGCS